MQLQDKVAIVTGGGRGIGRGMARRFAREGARVVIAQRDPASGERTCQEVEEAGGTALFVRTDVSCREEVEHLIDETVARFDDLDILVNNAGITGRDGPFLELSQEQWDRIIAVNQTGVFMCSQAAARVMAKTGGGNIIHITSVNAFVPQPQCCAYGAAKGALEALTRGMATDLVPYHIRVNAIAPGPIQTNLPDGAPPDPRDMTLLGRSGLPEEVAAAAVFLASEESGFITGQTLMVDGGTLVNGYNIYGTQKPLPSL